jgi:type VI secretion system secreted protein VgrG
MPLSQDTRMLAIGTPLGDDVLVLRSFSVREQLGRLFQIDAELISEDGTIDLDKVVGHNVTLRLSIGAAVDRFFNGFVSRMTQVANEGGLARYRATVVPWLWFLTRTSDCRIFQTKTAPEIIEAVFTGHGFNDFKLSLSGSYVTRDYCVQYRETDFNFVSRLMEQEGIYYYFQHENGKHTLVLADSISAHSPYDGYEEITFHELEKGAATREVITGWTQQTEALPVACALNDFDFTKPNTSLRSNTNVSRSYGAAQFEIYDYPGEYVDPNEGDRLAGVRLDEWQTQYQTLQGEANTRGLVTGCTFTLKNHPRSDQNTDYLITGVSLHADGGPFRSGSTEGEFFTCSFTAMPKSQQFRPARLTPKPVVQGPQTAIVVGTSGEEIYTDEYGRVKLQFHWDRYGAGDENSSCWVRVSQEWAGKKWGAIYIPRIGQEVIVEFLEGDPDRPIVTGRVYNAVAMPPYSLPAEMTKSTLKSNSTKGGNGFNEIRFEDKKDSEQVFIHGEKNLDLRVKNNAFETIGKDRHLVVAQNRFEHVKNNRSETVDNDHKEQITNDRNLNVGGKEAKAVGGSLSLTVTGDVIEVFQAKHSEQVTSDYYLKADNIVIEGMTSITINVGQSFIAIDSTGISIGTNGTISLQDSQGLTVKSGASIAMQDASGLTIKSSASISMQDSAGLSVQSGAQIQMDSPMTTVKGDGMLTLKGGMVMIN